MPIDDSKIIAEIARHRKELDAKVQRARFVNEDEWITHALAENVREWKSSNDYVLISFRGISLPFPANPWTGLLLLNPKERRGHSWLDETTGMFSWDDEIQIYEGDQQIPLQSPTKLLAIWAKGKRRFRDVPNKWSFAGASGSC